MKNIANKFSLFLAVCAYIVYFISAILCGGTVFGFIAFNICLWVSVMACGNMLQNKLITPCGLYENLPVSFCLGVIFLYINYIIFDTIGFVNGLIILPLAAGIRHLYKNKNNIRPDFLFNENSWMSYIIYIGFCAAFVVCILLPYARADILKNFYVHQDMIWSASNAASVHLGFPLQDMRLAGTTLNYHYLNDATAGILGIASGQPAYESFCFYWYMPVAIILIAGLYQTAKKFCTNDLLCRFIPFIVIFTPAFGGEFHYLSNINGQGSATLTLCGGLLLISLAGEEKIAFCKRSFAEKAGFVCGCIAVGFVISMFKSTIGALFILAVAASCIAGLFTGKTKKEHIVILLCIAAGFGIAYTFIFNKAINNLVFDGWDKLVNLPDTLGEIGIGFWIYAASLVPSIIGFKKLSFQQLCANAMFVGGCIAYVTYYHYSASQVYFILIAVPMMWLANSDFIGKFIFSKKFLSYTFITVMVVFGLYNSRYMLDYARSGVQAALRIFDLRMFDFDEAYVTADDYEAMVWLRENTDQDDIFATNRNNKYFDWGEGTFHYYTAISQRACFLESYRYCMDYSGMYKEVVRRLEDVSDHIFHRAEESEAFGMAAAEDIDYLVVFTPVSDPDWHTPVVFENSTVKIYKVQ